MLVFEGLSSVRKLLINTLTLAQFSRALCACFFQVMFVFDQKRGSERLEA